MATSQVRNNHKIFIGSSAHGTGVRSASIDALSDGEIGIFTPEGVFMTEALAATETHFKIALGRTGHPALVSDVIEKASITSCKLKNGVARANQVTTIGYNGTSGSLPVTNNNLYYVRLYIQELLSSNSDGQRIKHGVFKSDAAATQAEIAIGLTGSLINNFLREAEQYITFKALCDQAVTAANDFVNNITVVKGSKVVSVATAITWGAGATTLVVGDFVRMGSNGAGTALTDDVYRVEEVDIPNLTFTVDRPVQITGQILTAASSDAEVIALAVGAAAEWGITLTGADLSFGAPDYKYSLASWDTQLENFGTTSAVLATAAAPGSGTYEEVASLEAFLMGGYGEIYRMGAPLNHPQVLVANATIAGNVHDVISIVYSDTKEVSFQNQISPKAVTLCVPTTATNCGYALAGNADDITDVLEVLSPVTAAAALAIT